jgi:hypothetical protein
MMTMMIRFWCGSLPEGDHLENLGVNGQKYYNGFLRRGTRQKLD